MKYTTYILLLATFLFSATVQAKVYKTKKVTGNYTSPATWVNNDVPPYNITGADTVIIDAGAWVQLDTSLVFNNSNAALIINGKFQNSHTARSWDSITINNAFLGGIGEPKLDYVILNTTKPIEFNGTATCTFAIINFKSRTYINSSAHITIYHSAYVKDSVSTGLQNHVLFQNAKIYFEGGQLVYNALHNFTAQNVTIIYTKDAAGTTTGYELNWTYTKNVFEIIINVGTGDTLTLGSDIELSGRFTHNSGLFVLNNHNITLLNNSTRLPGAQMHSTPQSNIYIGNSLPNLHSFYFVPGGDTVNNFRKNGGFSTTTISSNLNIAGELWLEYGHLQILDNKLRLLPSASLKGGDDTSYIKMNDKGEVIQQAPSSQTTYYPVGTTNDFLPVRITNNKSTISDLSMGVRDHVLEDGETGKQIYTSKKMVEASWRMLTASTNIDVDMEVLWYQGLQRNGFDPKAAYIANHNGTKWDQVAYKAATPIGSAPPQSYWHKLDRKNITTTGIFNVFDSSSFLSVTNLSVKKQATLYPNPVQEVLHVSGVANGTAVQIFNTTGKLVQETLLQNNTINVTTLPAGTYYLKATGIKTTRFVKVE